MLDNIEKIASTINEFDVTNATNLENFRIHFLHLFMHCSIVPLDFSEKFQAFDKSISH